MMRDDQFEVFPVDVDDLGWLSFSRDRLDDLGSCTRHVRDDDGPDDRSDPDEQDSAWGNSDLF